MDKKLLQEQDTNLQAVRTRAESGDPDAQFELGLVFAFAAKVAAVAARQFVHQPEAGVVTRARVLGARISETDNELERRACHGAETKTPPREKRRRRRNSR